jgi:hypothetical protein
MDYGIPNIFLDVKPQSIVLIHIGRTSLKEAFVDFISECMNTIKMELAEIYCSNIQ